MVRINISWHNSYSAYITKDDKFLHSVDNIESKICLYDKNGKVIPLSLEDGVSMTFEVDCPFNVRRKINYTRNEVFIISLKDKRPMLFIPMDKVGLTLTKENVRIVNGGLFKYNINTYCINGNIVGFYGRDNESFISSHYLNRNDNTFSFNHIDTIEHTDKYEKVKKLYDEMKSLGISIGLYDCVKLLDNYTIRRKRNGKA